MAKQKSNKTGQGYKPFFSAKQVNAALEKSLMMVAGKMRAAHELTKEYVHNDNCPGCLSEIKLTTTVGQIPLSVSSWYCEAEKLGIYYVLCLDCSSKLPDEALYQAIQTNTLAAWQQNSTHD